MEVSLVPLGLHDCQVRARVRRLLGVPECVLDLETRVAETIDKVLRFASWKAAFTFQWKVGWLRLGRDVVGTNGLAAPCTFGSRRHRS